MTRAFLNLLATAAMAASLSCGTTAAWAQSGTFAPALTVDGLPITGYELDQRMQFMQLLGQKGDVEQQARDSLIEDRLRMEAARKLDIKVSAEDIKQGMEEFASRANMTADQFVTAIGQAGVVPETYRDFVAAGLAWREVVRAKYAGRVTISNAEIDRAISAANQASDVPRVQLSEIIVPANGGDMAGAMRKATKIEEALKQGKTDFARAARENSAAPSRDSGGKLGVIPVTNLPASVRASVLQMRAGEIGTPVAIPGGVAIFQMHGASKGGNPASGVILDYLQFQVAGGAAEIAALQRDVGTCDDLYRFARKAGQSRLTHAVQATSQVPADIGRELATLDPNEASTNLRRGADPVFLMLCSRGLPATSDSTETADAATPMDGAPVVQDTLGFGAGPSREAVRQEILNARLNKLSDVYLSELKANAIIATP